MASIHNINAGDKVRGTYYGVPFSGTVESHRPHTMNHHIELFFIALDAPITALGLERDGLQINASDNTAALARFECGTPAATIEKAA